MKKRRAMPVFLGLVAVLAAIGLWRYLSADTTQRPPQTATVLRGTVARTVLASGQIEASQLVSVGARVSGQIETLAVTLGQEVKAGDLIAEIDSRDQQNSVAQKQADLANIQAQITAKEADLRKAALILSRQQKLGRSDYASQETVEAAQADVDVLNADLTALEAQQKSAQIDVETAQIALGRTKITAPIAGTVVAVPVQQGATVNASQSAPTIVKIAALDQVLVKAEISEADVVNVKPGQAVSFTILGAPDHPYSATLRDVEPAPSEIEDSDTISTDEAIYYNGRFEVDNPGHALRIGMTTQITITLERAQNVLTVPSAALSRDGTGSAVTLYDASTGTYSQHRVEVGLNDKITAEIRSGLQQGDTVVLPNATGPAANTPAASGNRSRRMGPPMGF